MIQTILEITLVYSNGDTWFVGAFNSQKAADAWIAEEKTRPYWDPNTEIQIVDKSYEIILPIEEQVQNEPVL